MADDDGFLARWSRRKALVRQGQDPAPEAPAPTGRAAGSAPAAAALAPVASTAGGERTEPPRAAEAAQSPQVPQSPDAAPLTMDDVARLGKDGDYTAFTAPQVDPQVRNAAMKKLFHSDPHFNVMDGLDIYIDDYHTPDPLPKSMLRQMVQARFLGLLDDEVEEQPHPDAEPGAAAATSTDEDADLHLQPDDAAGREGDRPGPGDDAGGQPGER